MISVKIDSDLTLAEESYAVARLGRDLREAAAEMGDDEARYLVEAYYNIQELRIRSDHQVGRLDDTFQPNVVIGWLGNQNRTLEGQIKAALDKYSANHRFGAWPRSIVGIGPVIAAGLISHIWMGEWCEVCCAHDAEKCEYKLKKFGKKLGIPEHTYTPALANPTVGHVWAFAGLDPSRVWKEGSIRPWNADLKVLCWKAGQSFMKVQGRKGDFYGKMYKDQKNWYIDKNESGGFAAKAAADLKKRKWDKSKDAYKAYVSGKLPPAHIDAMARRYTVKIFLSHYWEVSWRIAHPDIEPVKPFPIERLGHAHSVSPPNFLSKPSKPARRRVPS